MTSNCQDALGHPGNSFMRGILFLRMQMQGKKRSKIGHLARLFNAADAFSGAKYTRKSECQDALVWKYYRITSWLPGNVYYEGKY